MSQARIQMPTDGYLYMYPFISTYGDDDDDDDDDRGNDEQDNDEGSTNGDKNNDNDRYAATLDPSTSLTCILIFLAI